MAKPPRPWEATPKNMARAYAPNILTSRDEPAQNRFACPEPNPPQPQLA